MHGDEAVKSLNIAVIFSWKRRACRAAYGASAIRWCSCLAVLLCVAPSYTRAQSSQVTPNNQTGIVPYNTYAGDHENVNLATSDLNLQIPLVTLPGRDHHDLSISYLYDSRIYELKAHVDSFYGFTGYYWGAVDS